MSLENTTEDLIQQVRDVTDEDNTTDVQDVFIIRMLNRAQQSIVHELTKKYSSHFFVESYYTSSDFINDAQGRLRVLQLPKQNFSYRIHNVDAKIGNVWYPVPQSPAIETIGLDFNNQSSLPVAYRIQGDDLYIYPDIQSVSSFRLRYAFRAPKLVATQGRITGFSTSNNTITLNSLGSGLTTSVDTLGAFINVIDGQTGRIKATLQVGGINTTTKVLTIKTSSLSRTTVFGYTVASSLPSDIALDDYVCLGSGTCVPFLTMDLTNYHVELASFYTKRSLGTVESADFSERENIMKELSSFWSGRENTLRIRRGGRISHPFLFFRGS